MTVRDSRTRTRARTPGAEGDPPSMAVHDRVLGPTQCGTTEDDHEVHERRMQTKHEPVYAGSSLSWLMHGKAPPEMPAFQPYRGKPAVRNDRESRGNDGIIRSPGSRLDSTRLRDEDGQPPHLLGRRRFLHLAAGAAALPAVSSIAWAQAYPTRTVRFILPFGAGSASDTTARLFAERLSARWGKPVVVENRPGGDGLVSLDAFVGAHEDHTMWFGPAGTFNVLPYQHDTLPFDPKRDLNPIASVSEVVLAVSTPVSMHVNSIDELVAMARAQPGKLNAAAANGISDFLLFGFFKSMGLQIVRVPYRDIMQAPSDLAESRIQVLSTSLAVVQALSKAGRIKVLAVTSRQRAPSAPDVPTAAEAGYPALTFESIGGVFGPRDMADKLRESIAADFQKIAEDPIIAKRLGDTGQIMLVLGPAQFGARVQEQRDKLATLAKTLGVKAAQ